MEKLKLEIEKHPNPYTIECIKEVGGIKVTECCKVPFSIGKYCDVVDIDACRILFGRPWQYDVDAKYLDRKHVYQLEKGV